MKHGIRRQGSRRLSAIIDGLGLDRESRSKTQVLEALDKAKALVEELL